MLIRRVEDRDGTRAVSRRSEPSTRAISDTTAFLMSTMLADVINAGTGARARSSGFTLPAAGKTGTTNDYNDAWFVGFTPKLVAGVWVGFDQPQHDPAERLRRRRRRAGLGEVHEGGDAAATSRSGSRRPPGIDDARGLPAVGQAGRPKAARTSRSSTTTASSSARSMVYTEYFARGTEPTAYCDLHPTRGIMTTARRRSSAAATSSPAPPRVEDTGRRAGRGTPATAAGDRRRTRRRRAPPSRRRRSAASGRASSAAARTTIEAAAEREAATDEEKRRLA